MFSDEKLHQILLGATATSHPMSSGVILHLDVITCDFASRCYQGRNRTPMLSGAKRYIDVISCEAAPDVIKYQMASRCFQVQKCTLMLSGSKPQPMLSGAKPQPMLSDATPIPAVIKFNTAPVFRHDYWLLTWKTTWMEEATHSVVVSNDDAVGTQAKCVIHDIFMYRRCVAYGGDYSLNVIFFLF